VNATGNTGRGQIHFPVSIYLPLNACRDDLFRMPVRGGPTTNRVPTILLPPLPCPGIEL